MMNIEALNETQKLTKEYKKTYGEEPDLSDCRLPGLTQEMTVELLKIMIADNKSLISAYSEYLQSKSTQKR